MNNASNFIVEDGFLTSFDGTKLSYRYYCNTAATKVILLVHGFGEHSGRYLDLIKYLTKINFSIFTFDLRGHGQSNGRRTDTLSIRNMEDDVNAAYKYINNQFESDNIIIISHSFGALITLRSLARFSFKAAGVVLSSPFLAIKMNIPRWKKYAVKITSYLFPTLRVQSGIDASDLSHDENISLRYKNDSLVSHDLTMRMFREMLFALKDTDNLIKYIDLPVLAQIGGSDNIVDSAVAKSWCQKLKLHNNNVTIKCYPDLKHEIYNESKKQIVFDDLKLWLGKL